MKYLNNTCYLYLHIICITCKDLWTLILLCFCFFFVYMCTVYWWMRRSSSVQFYRCQTQHTPFLCKLFTFYILIFFYSKHFIHCDMVPSRLSWAWRDIYVVRSSQFIFCLSHNMTLFLEHSRLVNIAFVSFFRIYKQKMFEKNDWMK